MVAVANGMVAPEERRPLIDLLRFEPAIGGFDLREAQTRFDLYADALLRDRRSLLAVRRAVRKVDRTLDRRLRILRFSMLISAADGDIAPIELLALRRIGKWLALDRITVELELLCFDARFAGSTRRLAS